MQMPFVFAFAFPFAFPFEPNLAILYNLVEEYNVPYTDHAR